MQNPNLQNNLFFFYFKFVGDFPDTMEGFAGIQRVALATRAHRPAQSLTRAQSRRYASPQQNETFPKLSRSSRLCVLLCCVDVFVKLTCVVPVGAGWHSWCWQPSLLKTRGTYQVGPVAVRKYWPVRKSLRSGFFSVASGNTPSFGFGIFFVALNFFSNSQC